MNMKLQKILSLLLVLVLILCCAAAASADEEEKEAEDGEEEVLDVIGEQTEDGYKIRLVNATGTDITGINIKPADGEEYTNLMEEDEVFEQEEASYLCYAPGEEETEETLYDLQIIWSDWTVGELHDVALSDIQEGEIQRAWNSLPYLVYVSVSTGEEVDTSADEQSTAEAEIAAGTWAYGGGSDSGSSGGSSGGYSSGGNSGGCITDAMFY